MSSWKNPPRRAIRSLPPEARRPATSTTAGILRPAEHATRVVLDRLPVAPALEPWVEHYWTVRWQVDDGEPFRSEVVPHPAAHLTFESGSHDHHGFAMPAALLHGVVTSRFTFDVAGEGRVFGVKFRPGGFTAFLGADATTWVDRVAVAGDLVPGAAALLREVLAVSDDAGRAAVVDAALAERLPAPDARYERLIAIVAGLVADATLVSVDDVCARFDVAPRTLQRLFRDYVGVGPKWVLQRYRLHDAVTMLDAGEGDDLAELAARLGWYDQAHFTRDFTAQVGVAPAAYAGRQSRGATSRARSSGIGS
ncbi:helix-turn-helix domain-containing protein [Nocardioides sp. TF02-7]|uniref:helix-turn-helix domain-containing protein n=1 Tax=Nocardioides sp. TF02-7 TaxID=2917724 RepID=UPI001F057CA2|nr:helix-turn-helix domain-containing protein [Nocardioides sp. TF02-7]UMG92469.1 helix-turn-helix domain-containing protein [Nocardioides sp. TF02-7]